MNNISHKKLLNSKWTAVYPVNKEKHFIVKKVILDEQDNIIHCLIEAVISKRVASIDWKELKNQDSWIQGWK